MESQTVFIEDVFFLHELGDFLYGYFANKVYEFSRDTLAITSTAPVEFAYTYPGNVTYRALPYQAKHVGIVEQCVYVCYYWGIRLVYKLPFVPPPFSYLLHDGKLWFCGHTLDLATLQLCEYLNFPASRLVFQHCDMSYAVYHNALRVSRKSVEVCTVTLPCSDTQVVSCNGGIAVLTDAKNTLLLNLARFPPYFCRIGLCQKLHYAYFFIRNGNVMFASPAIERKWAAGLLLSRMLEHESAEFPNLINDFGGHADNFDTAFYQNGALSSIAPTCNSSAEVFETIGRRYDPLLGQLKKQCDDTQANMNLLMSRQNSLATAVGASTENCTQMLTMIRDLQAYLDALRYQNQNYQEELDELRCRVISAYY